MVCRNLTHYNLSFWSMLLTVWSFELALMKWWQYWMHRVWIRNGDLSCRNLIVLYTQNLTASGAHWSHFCPSTRKLLILWWVLKEDTETPQVTGLSHQTTVQKNYGYCLPLSLSHFSEQKDCVFTLPVWVLLQESWSCPESLGTRELAKVPALISTHQGSRWPRSLSQGVRQQPAEAKTTSSLLSESPSRLHQPCAQK